MARSKALTLSRDEARALMLAAQGLLDPPLPTPGCDDARAVVERLGAVQVDTINVVRRSQYLVLWSRLGAYDDTLLDALLYPCRATMEYWSHAASIVPLNDYPYYRRDMLQAARHLYPSDHAWVRTHARTLDDTLRAVRERGPLASADFERAAMGRHAEAWDWFGLKESRRALHVLWTTGELMVHSRRGGQKVYDVRERVLAEAYRARHVPRDSALPSLEQRLRHFVRRTVTALGVVTPAWLWDYFRLRAYASEVKGEGAMATQRTAEALLNEQVAARRAVPVTVDGIAAPAFLARERLHDLARLRMGMQPSRTTLLSPFDNLLWDRTRARALFGYEVCFEAYVLPTKRRYGYYCLAILHHGQLVGRIDPKMDRDEGMLRVRNIFLEPGVCADAALLDGLAGALRDLARFLGARAVAVERADDPSLAPALAERVVEVASRC